MITLEQLTEIATLSQDDGYVSFNIEFVSICEDRDPDGLRLLSARELAVLAEPYRTYLDRKHDVVTNIILPELGKLSLKNFQEDLTLGQFIDLEHYRADGRMDKMAAVLYSIGEDQPGKKTRWEPYSDVDVEYRSRLFLQIFADQVVGAINEYQAWRDKALATYESLFEQPETDDDDGDNRAKARSNHKQFAWESFILFLANDDVTKWDKVCDLPVFLALNIASFRKGQSKNAPETTVN